MPAFALSCVSGSTECLNTNDDPLEVLKTQLQEFTELFLDRNEGGRQRDIFCCYEEKKGICCYAGY